MNYAAFIITYKRPKILMNTINSLLSQTKPPQKILIVDNDPELSAKSIVDHLVEVNTSYYATGVNAGPAGGAYWGLKKLFEEGWEWVLWVDDDDPPTTEQQLESIISILDLVDNKENVGIIGGVGVKFNYKKTMIERIPDDELVGVIDVDMIAGGQFPFVNKKVFDNHLLPNPDLFFGFEDLEFCLRVKNKGFRLLILGDELLRLRTLFKKLGNNKTLNKPRNTNHLWRDYYSVRTIIFILVSNNSFILIIKYSIKNIIKIVLGFKNGWEYGKSQAYYILLGLFDGLNKRLGFRIAPMAKSNS